MATRPRKRKSGPTNTNSSDSMTLKKKISQVSIAEWFTILNVILTVLIGSVGAYYLNYLNEQYQLTNAKLQANIQKQLIQYQIESQAQSNYAHVTIHSYCGDYPFICSGNFEVLNSGPQVATDVTIDLVLLSIPPADTSWEHMNNVLSKFTIITKPYSLPVSQKLTRINTIKAVSGNNSIVLNIKTLPPDVPLQVSVNFSPPLPANLKEVSKFTEIYEGQITNLSSNNVDNLLAQYLETNSTIAYFDTSVSCTTCEGNVQDLIISASSIENWLLESTGVPAGSNCAYGPCGILHVTYWVPTNTSPLPLPNSKFLLLYPSGDTLYECQHDIPSGCAD